MKDILLKVLSFFRNFFLSLKIHVHIGSKDGEVSEKNDKKQTIEDSDDPELKE